jgi:hypothetical protein
MLCDSVPGHSLHYALDHSAGTNARKYTEPMEDRRLLRQQGHAFSLFQGTQKAAVA